MENESLGKRTAAKIVSIGFISIFLFSSCSKKEPPIELPAPSENRVVISGSAAVTPLLRVLAGAFMKEEGDIEIVFPPDSHSGAGVAGTVEGQYDIGTLSREMLPEEKESGLRYLHLAIDGLVFATNPTVKISNLNSDQIRDIYSGKIANWSQLGGPNAKIVVIDRPEHTSAKLAFRKTLLGPDLHVTPQAIVVERPWQVMDSIQLVPYSIGITSLGEVVMENPPANIISVNEVSPTPANLREGKYKFFRPFGLVLSPESSVSTMKFVNFIFSDKGGKIIENSGYNPHRYEILIGIVPEQDLLVQNRRYRPFAEYLSGKLENRFSVKLKLFPTYIDVCRSLAKGEINAAFLGSLAYTTVRDHVNVLARPDYNGVSTYRGLIFTRKNSSIKTLEQMRGKRLVLGGKTTTAGYVFPLYYFKKNGIPDYEKYFSETIFLGTHEDAILSVLHNRADVGAAKDLIYNIIAKENPIVQTNLTILAESPPVPSNAFVLRKDVSFPCFDCHQGLKSDKNISAQVDIQAAIKEYLLTMSQDPAAAEALISIGNANRFLETRDSDYEELYKMLKDINLDPESLLNEN
jgi:phosphate transport system substrate-binding protein